MWTCIYTFRLQIYKADRSTAFFHVSSATGWNGVCADCGETSELPNQVEHHRLLQSFMRASRVSFNRSSGACPGYFTLRHERGYIFTSLAIPREVSMGRTVAPTNPARGRGFNPETHQSANKMHFYVSLILRWPSATGTGNAVVRCIKISFRLFIQYYIHSFYAFFLRASNNFAFVWAVKLRRLKVRQKKTEILYASGLFLLKDSSMAVCSRCAILVRVHTFSRSIIYNCIPVNSITYTRVRYTDYSTHCIMDK